MLFEQELKRRVAEVEEILRQYLPAESGFQKTVIEAMNYSFLAGGKRLRPMLMLETYRMFGGKSKVVEPFMAAMEMIHTASLIHDDLPAMDDDEYRRGKKTAHVVYGEAFAILAGDALILYAFETAARAFAIEPGNAKLGAALSMLAEKSGIYGMVGGQTVDVEMEGKPIEKAKLDFIYRLKTGALIEASMMIGAMLAGATQNETEQVGQAAAKIGLAFQIQDDILDVAGTAEEIGKPAGSDEKNHKTTYVTLKGLEQSAKDVEAFSEEGIRCLDSLVVENPFLKELLTSLIHRRK